MTRRAAAPARPQRGLCGRARATPVNMTKEQCRVDNVGEITDDCMALSKCTHATKEQNCADDIRPITDECKLPDHSDAASPPPKLRSAMEQLHSIAKAIGTRAVDGAPCDPHGRDATCADPRAPSTPTPPLANLYRHESHSHTQHICLTRTFNDARSPVLPHRDPSYVWSQPHVNPAIVVINCAIIDPEAASETY